jgi:hypothetical protein
VDAIRLASAEEIASIVLKSDLDVRVPTQIVAFDNHQTNVPDLAVIKQVFELDPVHFADQSSDKRKALFMWSMMNHLRLIGTPVVYFSIAAGDSEWQQNARNFGVEQVSAAPELRFKMTLVKDQSVNQERNELQSKPE